MTIDGRLYPTVEHRYQASKAIGHEQHEHVRTAKTPLLAPRRGRKVTIKPDFFHHKHNIMIMREAIYEKFNQNDHLARKLLATGDAVLVEKRTWKRKTKQWRREHNFLGTTLMAVRDRIRAEKGAELLQGADPDEQGGSSN